MILILSLLAFSTKVYSIEDTKVEDTNILDEYILCRHCGSDVSASSSLISVSSPVSRYAFNDTLFRKEQVFIQVLSNGLIFDFPVITAAHSTCVSVGEWEDHETWFPGYRWKICACPDCGDFVGWFFEPTESIHIPKKSFYALILWTLIGESCKYYFQSLLKLGVFHIYLLWVKHGVILVKHGFGEHSSYLLCFSTESSPQQVNGVD